MMVDDILDVLHAELDARRRSNISSMLLDGVDADQIDAFLDAADDYLAGWRANTRRQIERILSAAGGAPAR